MNRVYGNPRFICQCLFILVVLAGAMGADAGSFDRKNSPTTRRVDLNTTNVVELMTLPGIDEYRAKMIEAYRFTYGPFMAVEDLNAVPDITDEIFAGIRDNIYVDTRTIKIKKKTDTIDSDIEEWGPEMQSLADSYISQGENGKARPILKYLEAVIAKLVAEHKMDSGDLALSDIQESLEQIDGTPSVDQLLNGYPSDSQVERMFEDVLMRLEKNLGPNHVDVAKWLNRRARIYCDQKQFKMAEPLYKRAIRIAEKLPATRNWVGAESLSKLGMLYLMDSRETNAEPVYKRLMAYKEKNGDTNYPSLDQCLNDLSYIYSNQQRYAEAESALKRALDIQKKSGREGTHDELSTRLWLGNTFYQRARYDEAESQIKRALEIQEKTNGPNKDNVPGWIGFLGVIHIYQRRYTEAESTLNRALELREKSRGPDHEDVAEVLSNLGELYDTQGLFAKAEPLYMRALSILEKIPVTHHMNPAAVLESLSGMYKRMGRQTESDSCAVRARDFRRR